MNATKIRPREDQNFWNFLFVLFFIAVVCVALLFLYSMRSTLPHSMPFFDAVLIVLAAFRLTRLLVYDKATRFFREWFVQKREVTHDDDVWVELVPYTYGIRATLHELLNCPWCIGMWTALIVTFCYFAFTWSWFVILFLAVAGAASFIQISANALGWKAEHLKTDFLAKEDRS